MTVEPDEIVKSCVEVLDRILNDDSVPRNIRRVAETIKKTLSDESESLFVRASIGISKLDEVSNDPNMPLHTRPLIWGLASQLERIPVN